MYLMSKKQRQNSQGDNKSKSALKVVIISTAIVVFLWAMSFLLFFVKGMEARGQFGDMFGAVNALFSGLAFAGLILTLTLQRQELSLQRDELQLTREELKNQRAEFQKENETLKYQRFENVFYSMLNLQQKIVEGLRFDYIEEETTSVSGPGGHLIPDRKNAHKVVTGREVFRYTFEDVELDIGEKNLIGQSVVTYGYRRFLNKKGISGYDSTLVPTLFDHFFRHLYKIVQFVESQGFSFDESYKYVSLLRGTLSRYELVWIYYNGLDPSNYKLHHLIEKYSILKNIRAELLTRCMETDNYFKEKGTSPKEVRECGFSGSDFEPFLTNDDNDSTRYNISAFWKKDDLGEGQAYLERWRAFIEKTKDKEVI